MLDMHVRATAVSIYAAHSPSITSGANAAVLAEVDEVGRRRASAGREPLEIGQRAPSRASRSTRPKNAGAVSPGSRSRA